MKLVTGPLVTHRGNATTMTQSTITRRRSARAVWIGLVLILAGLISVALFVPGRSSSVAFDPAKWRTSGSDPRSNLRVRMVVDLIATRLKPGVNQAEVVEWLGPPDPQNYFSGSGYDAMYRLGRSSGWLPGPTYLTLDFDAEGKLLRADLLQD